MLVGEDLCDKVCIVALYHLEFVAVSVILICSRAFVGETIFDVNKLA